MKTLGRNNERNEMTILAHGFGESDPSWRRKQFGLRWPGFIDAVYHTLSDQETDWTATRDTRPLPEPTPSVRPPGPPSQRLHKARGGGRGGAWQHLSTTALLRAHDTSRTDRNTGHRGYVLTY